MKLSAFFLIFLFPFGMLNITAQDNPGCTDPQANNYDPSADFNDGSCTYNPTIYNPDFKYLLPSDVEETSGLIYWRNALWTINDSGNSPVLFKLDTLNGTVLQEINIQDATNVDWESLAQDETYIFIGDFGNNSGNRDDLSIYRIEKNTIPETGNGSVSSDQISFVYEDFPDQPIKRKENNFDCEAFISIGDSLYLFSKNRGDEKTKLYRLPKSPGDYTAKLLSSYDVNGLVTGADYNAEAKEVTLVGYTNNTYIPFLWLLFDYTENYLFSGNKRRIDMLNITATQTEAITYVQGKNGFISSEGSAIFTQSAYGFSTSQWTDTLSTGFARKQAREFNFVLSPNPVEKNKLNVFIENLPVGDYRIEIYDTSGGLMQIKEYSIKTEKSSVNVKLKIGNLIPGLYFVRMRSGYTTVEKKFIKQ